MPVGWAARRLVGSSARRLFGEDQVESVVERTDDGYALLLTTRKLVQAALRAVAEPVRIDQCVNQGRFVAGIATSVKLESEQDVSAHVGRWHGEKTTEICNRPAPCDYGECGIRQISDLSFSEAHRP